MNISFNSLPNIDVAFFVAATVIINSIVIYVIIQKGIVGLGILPTSNQNNQPEHPCFERG